MRKRKNTPAGPTAGDMVVGMDGTGNSLTSSDGGGGVELSWQVKNEQAIRN